MGKLVFWIAVAAIIWAGARFLNILQRKSDDATKKRSADAQRQELVLSCAHCGVHIPQSEAIFDGRKAYCCEAHRQAA